jgi:hypothetical protein
MWVKIKSLSVPTEADFELYCKSVDLMGNSGWEVTSTFLSNRPQYRHFTTRALSASRARLWVFTLRSRTVAIRSVASSFLGTSRFRIPLFLVDSIGYGCTCANKSNSPGRCRKILLLLRWCLFGMFPFRRQDRGTRANNAP